MNSYRIVSKPGIYEVQKFVGRQHSKGWTGPIRYQWEVIGINELEECKTLKYLSEEGEISG